MVAVVDATVLVAVALLATKVPHWDSKEFSKLCSAAVMLLWRLL